MNTRSAPRFATRFATRPTIQASIRLGLSLVLGLGLNVGFNLSLAAEAIAQLRLPEAPKRGTPKGNQRPGTRRPENSCPKTVHPLTAINANNGEDWTRSSHPSFVFYSPYRTEQVSNLEFLLLDSAERKTLFRTQVRPLQQPGFFVVTLPTTSAAGLEEGSLYRWYLKLDCLDSAIESPHVVLDGWIQRESQTAEAAWMDVVRDRAQAYLQNPQDAQRSQDWFQLLQMLSLEDLVSPPRLQGSGFQFRLSI